VIIRSIIMKSKPITLREDQVVRDNGLPLTRRFRRWLILMFGKLAVFLTLSVVTAHYLQVGYVWGKERYDEAKAVVLDKFTIVKQVKEYTAPDEATVSDIIHAVAHEYEIDPIVLEVLQEKESAGGKLLYRFEPSKFVEREKTDRRLGLSEDERRMENSSHGIFHVMGYTARSECGLHWSALYDPWTSAKCAATVVSKHMETTKGIKSPGARLREVFRRYNGSGPGAERYADDAMSRIAQRLYHGMMKLNRG
jgi:hypothetical protein